MTASPVTDIEATELAKRVKTFLLALHYPSLRQLEVEMDHDVLVVRGHVGSFHERQLAVACCKRVAGVRRIEDQLQVSKPG